MSYVFGMDCCLGPSLVKINESVVVKWLLDGSHNDSEFRVILDDIADLMLTGSVVGVNSISRKANRPAYVLAKEALKISGDAFCMEECTTYLKLLIFQVRMGKSALDMTLGSCARMNLTRKLNVRPIPDLNPG
ncbi:hypothetical protein QYF36_019570 [Acer negundo]|nr:hypothetical protein QYF36_019570 [Acer negundo]